MYAHNIYIGIYIRIHHTYTELSYDPATPLLGMHPKG
jgi:hypothetical protein